MSSGVPATSNSYSYTIITGGPQAAEDHLSGTSGQDGIWGFGGNDVLNGNGGKDDIYGGSGNDWLGGDAGDDLLYGGSGDDVLDGGAGDDILFGGTGADRFEFLLDEKQARVNFGAAWGHDTIADFNRAEHDTLDLRDVFSRLSDSDVSTLLSMIGQTGNDTHSFTSFNGDIYSFRTSTSTDAHGILHTSLWVQDSSNPNDQGATISLDDIGSLQASDFLRETTKLIHGSALNNGLNLSDAAHAAALNGKGATYYGFAGDDVVTGTATHDHLYGGDGNDLLSGGTGNDALYGGNGNDRLSGDDGNDSLFGGNGNDMVYGGNGNDVLWGDAGNDQLFGGNGNDYLYAGTADNVTGNTVTGGAGNDTFYIGGHTDRVDFLLPPRYAITYALDAGKTVITDFTRGEDHIKIADIFDNKYYNTGDSKTAIIDAWLSEHLTRSANGHDLVFAGDNHDAAGHATTHWEFDVKNAGDMANFDSQGHFSGFAQGVTASDFFLF